MEPAPRSSSRIPPTGTSRPIGARLRPERMRRRWDLLVGRSEEIRRPPWRACSDKLVDRATCVTPVKPYASGSTRRYEGKRSVSCVAVTQHRSRKAPVGIAKCQQQAPALGFPHSRSPVVTRREDELLVSACRSISCDRRDPQRAVGLRHLRRSRSSPSRPSTRRPRDPPG